MKMKHSRQYYVCLTLTLLVFAQLTLPAFAETSTPNQPNIPETDHTDLPTPDEQHAPETGPVDNVTNSSPDDPVNENTDNPPALNPAVENADNHPDPASEIENSAGDNPNPASEQTRAEQDLPPSEPEDPPTPTAAKDLPAAQTTTASDSPQPAPGNSYRAMVLPEDDSSVKTGENAILTATFTELNASTPLASFFLYIPDSLSIVDYSSVVMSDDWNYRWIAPGEEDDGFSKILSLWATIDTAKLRENKSVSATFTVTATADQEHHFATSAWQDRATNEEGKGVEPGTTVNNRSTSYSEPRINVAVTSAAGLNQVRNNPHWHYLQQNDIDLSSFDSGPGWQPIGSIAQPFIGSYNGGRHTIDNLTINRPEDNYVGLFGYIGQASMLTDISLTDVNVTGGRYVGGLVGWVHNDSAIKEATVSGMVTGSSTSVGGIVGYNYDGSLIDSHASVTVSGTSSVGGLVGFNQVDGSIINSTAAGTVSGSHNIGGLVGRNYGLIELSSFRGIVEATAATETRLGGLVGYNQGGASICCSFAEATVSAPFGTKVGGLVGENNSSSLLYSYASGTVTGKDYVGGLIGLNTAGNAQVTNSYSLGVVTGNTYVGGLVGANTTKINNSYSLVTLTANSNCGGLIGGASNGTINNGFYHNSQPQNAFGSALSDSALKLLTTYSEAVCSEVGWNIADLEDFDSTNPAAFVWYIETGEGYPILWWQHQPAPDPNPNPNPGDGGNNTNNNFNSPYYALLTIAPLNRQSALGLTAHLVLANSTNTTEQPLIGPGFVVSGSWSDLLQAEAAYKNAYANYIHLTEANPGTAQILLQLDLTLSRAAILALHQRLSADPTLLPATKQAYHQALQLLNQHSHLLTQSQKLQAETILAEILSVLQL